MFCEIAIKDLGCQVFLMEKTEAQLLVHCVNYQLPVTWWTIRLQSHTLIGLLGCLLLNFTLACLIMNTRLEQRKTMTEKVRDEILFKYEMVELNRLEVLYHSDM